MTAGHIAKDRLKTIVRTETGKCFPSFAFSILLNGKPDCQPDSPWNAANPLEETLQGSILYSRKEPGMQKQRY